MPITKRDRFDILVNEAQNCKLCPRMEGRRRVLSHANGNYRAAVMFIGEAPGRLGAERTGVPMCGDATGVNFERLIASVGWTRDDIFVTNAVLCNPVNDGLNDKPSFAEMQNCSEHLRNTIDIVNPLVVATLGATALEAVKTVSYHDFKLNAKVAHYLVWYNRFLFPLYHPSPRALLHRSMQKQRNDFKQLKELAEGLINARQTQKCQ